MRNVAVLWASYSIVAIAAFSALSYAFTGDLADAISCTLVGIAAFVIGPKGIATKLGITFFALFLAVAISHQATASVTLSFIATVALFLTLIDIVAAVIGLVLSWFRNDGTKLTKATMERIQHIQRISDQARQEIRHAGESYSAQARALAQRK